MRRDESEESWEIVTPIPTTPESRAASDRWVEEGHRFDGIIDDPEQLARFMDELIVRVALGTILEDYRYQRAVNQLVVNFFQIGRITHGDFRLPAVNMHVYNV